MLGSDTMIQGVCEERRMCSCSYLQFLLSLKKKIKSSQSLRILSHQVPTGLSLCVAQNFPASTFIMATLVAPLLLLSGATWFR